MAIANNNRKPDNRKPEKGKTAPVAPPAAAPAAASAAPAAPAGKKGRAAARPDDDDDGDGDGGGRSTPLGLEIDGEVLEFIEALDRFKKSNNRPFPSWSEVLFVLKELGYRRG